MAWHKWSDTAGDHPNFARLFDLDYYSPELKRELMGFLFFCASHSALYFTDYIIEEGVAKKEGGMEQDVLGGGRFRLNWERLVDAALFTGFFTQVVHNNEGRTGYRLLADPDNFVHIILKSEADWNKGRDKDLNDPILRGKVRLRDGDQCRWCGIVVNFDARNGGRAGTYDHATSMVVANGDASKLYVSCRQCNQQRGNGKNWTKKLRPAPVNPYYSESTVEQLGKWGFNVQPTTPPIFTAEVEPASESASVEPSQAPQVEIPDAQVPFYGDSEWTPVEPVAVESPSVEPSQAPQVEISTNEVPVDDHSAMIAQFEKDLQDSELEGAPDFVKESVEASAPSARRAPVEPQKQAPGRVKRHSGRVQPDFCRNRQKRSGESLEVPGRDGSGRETTYPKTKAEEQRETESPTPRKRKRRRKRKSNG